MTRPDSSQILHLGRRLDHQVGNAYHVDALGAVGDGVTDDTQVIRSALEGASLVVLGGVGKTYLVDAGISIPSGTTFLTHGATLRIRDSAGTAGITVAGDVRIDHLNIEIPSGIQSRGVYIQAVEDVTIDRITVTATDQQGPSPSTLQAVAVDDCSRVRIGYIRVTNYDRPVRFQNCDDLRIGGVSIESYVRGIYIESCTDLWIGKSRIETASANASATAGHNGILIQAANSDCSDLVLENVYVANSGEHGIRVGGGAYQTRNLRIVAPVVSQAGVAGIKVQSPADGAASYLYTENVKIIDAIIEDCGPTDMSGITTSFDNYNAMVLKYIRGLTVSNPIVRKKSRTYAAKGGIYLQSIVNGQINGGVISDCKYDGIKIDLDSSGNVDVTDLSVTDTQCVLNGGNGINLLYPAWTVRRLVIDGVKLTSNTGYGINISIDGGGGTINTMHVSGVVEANTAGAVASDNAGVMFQLAGQFTAPATAPRDGSTWLDRTGGQFLVLKTGTWTAM